MKRLLLQHENRCYSTRYIWFLFKIKKPLIKKKKKTLWRTGAGKGGGESHLLYSWQRPQLTLGGTLGYKTTLAGRACIRDLDTGTLSRLQEIFESQNTIFCLQMICPTDSTQKMNPPKIPSKGHPRAHFLAEFKKKFQTFFFYITICR